MRTQLSFPHLTAFLAACGLTGAALLAGCGGGGGGGSSSGPQTTNYAEAVTLADGQAGALNLAVQPNNTTTGTLAVAGANPSARPRAAGPRAVTTLPVGVYNVTGTLTNGSYNLTGTIPSTSASFTLTVTLPSGTTAGSFSLATGGNTYTGTLATAPTGTTANSAIAGTYQTISLTNPVSGQTVTCPGSLSFASAGASGNDNCVASEITVLSPNGTITTTASSLPGTTSGTYSVTGNIVRYQGTETGNSEPVTRYYTYALNGSTLTLTLLASTQADEAAQAADLEVFTFTKTTVTTSFPYAGTYLISYQGNGPSGPFSSSATVVLGANGAAQFTETNAANGGGTGTATVNSSGQIVLMLTGNSGQDSGNTFTLTGTVSGSVGSYTISGPFTDLHSQSGTFSATEGATTANNPFAGTYTGVSSSDPSYGYDTAITNVVVTSSGVVTANVNEGNVIGSISGSVNSASVITASGGSTQDTYTFTGTFQTVNGVMEATGTYTASGQTLPGHWVIVQSASTGADSQIAGAYAGSVTGTVTSSGTSGTAGTIINANGTATVADNAGDVGIGNATLNGSGQVVLTVTNPNNGGVITFTGTISGAAGSQVYVGNVTDNGGGSGTFNFTQFNPAQTHVTGNAVRHS